MILYFADRRLTVLGMASTELPAGAIIEDDKKVGDIETGMQSFEFVIHWAEVDGMKTKDWTKAGNYVFRKEGSLIECFTIIETEENTGEETTEVYAEDAGLDLLNEVALPFTATEAKTASWYVEKFAYDSGFEIGLNEIGGRTRTLSWDGESTVAERIASVMTQFDAEFSFGFEFHGLNLVRKTINLLERRGNDNGVQLRANKELSAIRVKTSIADVATALYVTGGTPEDAENPITLSGYTIPTIQSENGNFFLDGAYLKSRSALAKWSRYLNPSEPTQTYTGHIMKTYSYDTTSQSELCTRAINELKKVSEAVVNYEVDIVDFPESLSLGDTVTIIDQKNDINIKARILKIETSIVNRSHTATVGDYIS